MGWCKIFFDYEKKISYFCLCGIIIHSIMSSKKLYIISGCNGAGKTTASVTILPEILDCKEFVYADEIARGLSPFNPENVAIQAGRLMLERIEYLLDQDESFAIETTLSTKSYQKLVAKAHDKGLMCNFCIFGCRRPNLPPHV